MPTVTEITNPELTFCKLKDDHCLCPKCPATNCSHNCFECKRANKIYEYLLKRQSLLLNKKSIREFLDSVTKPVHRCSLKKIIEDELEKKS